VDGGENSVPEKPEAAPAPKPAAPAPKPAAPAPVTLPVKTPEPASPLGMVKAGRLPDAAKLWKKQLSASRTRFTIQLEIACQESTVLEAFEIMNDSADLALVPLDFKGRSCYRVLYGVFPSPIEAEAKRKKLPALFLQQQSPAQVIPLSKALT
jgi:septal ring-binding cell division protein DamX